MPMLPLKPRAFSPLLPSHQSPIFPQHQPPLSSSLQSRLVFTSVPPVDATHLEMSLEISIYAILNCLAFLFVLYFLVCFTECFISLNTDHTSLWRPPLYPVCSPDAGCWFVMLMSKLPPLEWPFCVLSGNKGQEGCQALWMFILTTSRTGGGVSGRPGKRLRLYSHT